MSLRGTIAASLLLLLPPVLAACSREPPSAEKVRASGATFTAEVGSTRPPGWPSRVLITNDDGITAPGLAALVRAFSAMTEVVVVAPAGNRSGSTSYASILSGRVDVDTVAVNGARAAYAVHGYPADCVLIALKGLMMDEPPDLVISGINAGANTGDAWAYSGTLGAARIAALHGVPAIAVSGGVGDALPAIADWVVQLTHTAIVQELAPLQYLTVDAPETPLAEIQGVSVVRRAKGAFGIGVARSEGDTVDSDVWMVTGFERAAAAPTGTDIEALAGGRIAVTIMRADEQDLVSLRQLEERAIELPTWASP